MKVHYFDAYGRAEPIRMILSHAKVPYEDVRHSKEEVQKLKDEGKLEFGKLPAVEHEGKFYSETVSIVDFIGRKHGYYPEDAKEAWRVDSIVDSFRDLQQ